MENVFDPRPGERQTAAPDAHARRGRFVLHNPDDAPVIGFLATAEVAPGQEERPSSNPVSTAELSGIDCDAGPDLSTAGRRIGDQDGLERVVDAGRGCATGNDRVDECLEFEPVGLGETLDEEEVAFAGESGGAVEASWDSLVEIGDDLAERAVNLGADVVAVRSSPGVLDNADASPPEAEHDDSMIDIVELGEIRLDQDGTGGGDIDDVVFHEEAGGVEVVNSQVPKESAAGPQVRHRRHAVAGKTAEHLDGSNLARIDQLASAGIAGVEAPLETDLEGDARSLDNRCSLARTLDRAGERFLREDRFTVGGGELDVLVVQAGRGNDDDGIDARVGDECVHVSHERTGGFAGGFELAPVGIVDGGGNEASAAYRAVEMLGVQP
ncbi:MAG: hypothetical protein QOG89_901, partial [Thermomicrobiales bacterium]|nr:hypothetical protein [Thermomicrobiales bacterium]